MATEPKIITGGAAVKDLPAARRPSGRELRYVQPLKDIADAVAKGADVEAWTPIAEYESKLGATQVKNDLEAGKRRVWLDAGAWEFASRRNDTGGSTLYARLRDKVLPAGGSGGVGKAGPVKKAAKKAPAKRAVKKSVAVKK